MLLHLTVTTALLGVASACSAAIRPEPRCSVNGSMKGVFLMIDGSRELTDSWPKIKSFVHLFKKHVDHEIPFWLMQYSSSVECHEEGLYPTCVQWCGDEGDLSWGCYGDRDPCLFEKDPNLWISPRCPKTNIELLPANWTDALFYSAADNIFNIHQQGWTTPWWFLMGTANRWIQYKKKMGLSDDDRALVIFLSDGQFEDDNYEKKAKTAFKEANMKFVGIQQVSPVHSFANFTELADNGQDDIIQTALDGSQLNQDLVERIIERGCNC